MLRSTLWLAVAPAASSPSISRAPWAAIGASVVCALAACDPPKCPSEQACPPEAPHCGPSGVCTDIRPPDIDPIGSGVPVDETPDTGGSPDPGPSDAGPLVCADDAREDNDTRAAATPAADGTAIEGRVCGDDDDWYSIEAASGCSVQASLTQMPAAGGTGDIDMLMFDAAGALVATANTPAGPEALQVTAASTGTYFVRLRAGSRDDVAYTLTLSSTCADELMCPADDASEDNDDAMTRTSLVEGVAHTGVLCGSDEDWFGVPVHLGCIAEVSLTFEHSAGDLDLHLVGPEGAVRARSVGVTDEERVARVVTEPGFSARVFLVNTSLQNTYQLRVDELCAGQVACPSDDPFEPNDGRFEGIELFGGAGGADAVDEVFGVVCANDDFFRLGPQPGCTVRGTLQFAHAEGDLDLEVLRVGDGTSLDRSVGIEDLEEVEFVASDSAQVAFRVYGLGDASNAYRLRVTTDCP